MTLTGVINDRYEIEREVGHGGMSTVYLARDSRHGNRVAVKVLSPDLASMVSGERFTREIRITAGLQHPHILPVFDSGTFNGLPYYVMPYIDGPTVEQRIKQEGALPINEALEIAAEVADALDHAHAQGFVHRDIKPSNILLAHGHAVIADFGIARALEPVTDMELTKTGIAVGTAAYMSPEQSAGEDVDGRSDIYSLGCVLYEMLAGKPPFSATSPRALMAKHWMNEVPSLSALRRSVRRSIEELVFKAMAKRADQRYATAGEFEEALQRVSTEEKLVAAGFTPSEDQGAFDPSAPPTPSDSELTTIAPEMASGEVRALVPAVPVDTASGEIVVRRRSPWLTAAIGLLAVAAVGFAAWRLTRPATPALDRNRIIVYPLLVPTDFSGPRTVGEDIGTMIGTALDGVSSLRWIDGWPLLTPEVRRDVRTLASAHARRLARSKRAAWYLTGRIVVRGDSSEVFLELTDVDGDSTVARGRAIGPTASAWRTGLHAVNTLLPSLIQPGTPDINILAEWKDRDPAAVASFLLAEGAFRRVHLVDALERYRDALRADSTFALAAIRGAQAAVWNHRSDEAATFLKLALRQPLPPRYTHFARGYEAYLAGAADSAVAEFRRVISLDPEMAVAWMQLGETYMHLLPVAGNPDSLGRQAFDEAYRLDPAAKPLLFHAIEVRLRQRDTAAAAPMLREFLAADPDSLLSRHISLMYHCVTSGADAVPWSLSARIAPLATLGAAHSLKGGGANLDCAGRGFEAVMNADTAQAGAGRRWAAIVGLGSVLLAKGRSGQARAHIDSAIARGWGGGSFYLMAGPVYPALQGIAGAIAQRDEQTYGPGYARCPYTIRLWQLGAWEAARGRAEVAVSVHRTLEARAKASGLSADARLARSMRALSTLAMGDTARAFPLLAALLAEPVSSTEIAWDFAAPRGMERMIYSRLLLARRDFRAALDVANVFDAAWPSVYLLYVPASLELRAEIAGAMANRQLAGQFRDRFDALRRPAVVAAK